MTQSQARRAITALVAKDWFPQLPIALAVALLGLLHLLPVIDQVFAMHLHLRTAGHNAQTLDGVSLLGISQSAVSIFLLVMSIGLARCSRLAWMLAVVVLFGYTVFGIYRLGGQFSQPINSLSDAFYVGVVTMSTVGFGDFSPTTAEARLFMTSVIIFSVTVLSTAVGATLIPALVKKIEQVHHGKHNRMSRNQHYIIVGYSALSANTFRELTAREEKVMVILRNTDDAALFPGKDVDIVIGDGSDLETLREAGADKAKAILALLDDDSENAFVVLAAKELEAGVKTVAAVNQLKHLGRVRRVHPDMIIAPQVLGGELLTSMLTGEHIDVKKIMGSLLGQTEQETQK